MESEPPSPRSEDCSWEEVRCIDFDETDLDANCYGDAFTDSMAPGRKEVVDWGSVAVTGLSGSRSVRSGEHNAARVLQAWWRTQKVKAVHLPDADEATEDEVLSEVLDEDEDTEEDDSMKFGYDEASFSGNSNFDAELNGSLPIQHQTSEEQEPEAEADLTVAAFSVRAKRFADELLPTDEDCKRESTVKRRKESNEHLQPKPRRRCMLMVTSFVVLRSVAMLLGFQELANLLGVTYVYQEVNDFITQLNFIESKDSETTSTITSFKEKNGSTCPTLDDDVENDANPKHISGRRYRSPFIGLTNKLVTAAWMARDKAKLAASVAREALGREVKAREEAEKRAEEAEKKLLKLRALSIQMIQNMKRILNGASAPRNAHHSFWVQRIADPKHSSSVRFHSNHPSTEGASSTQSSNSRSPKSQFSGISKTCSLGDNLLTSLSSSLLLPAPQSFKDSEAGNFAVKFLWTESWDRYWKLWFQDYFQERQPKKAMSVRPETGQQQQLHLQESPSASEAHLEINFEESYGRARDFSRAAEVLAQKLQDMPRNIADWSAETKAWVAQAGIKAVSRAEELKNLAKTAKQKVEKARRQAEGVLEKARKRVEKVADQARNIAVRQLEEKQLKVREAFRSIRRIRLNNYLYH